MSELGQEQPLGNGFWATDPRKSQILIFGESKNGVKEKERLIDVVGAPFSGSASVCVSARGWGAPHSLLLSFRFRI